MWTTRFSLLCLAASCTAAGAQGRVRDTKFTTKRGFFDAPFSVSVSSKTDGAWIRYTLDGSVPTPENGFGGPSPQEIRIETTTVLRAIAFREGMEPTNVDTQTYVFPAHVLRQPRTIPGYPTPMLRSGENDTVQLDYEMDPELLGTEAARRSALRGLRSIPTLSVVLPKEHLFGESGIYFSSDGTGPTHAASIEVLYPETPGLDFQVDCGLESHATSAVKRSFKLKFKNDYGPGKLRSSFFRNAPLHGDSAAAVHDRIVLRAGHIRSFALRGYPDKTTYTRDQWLRDSQIAMSGIGARGTFVHLFLNGLYWGLYNAVERPDAWFTSAYLGGEREDWFAVNHERALSGDASRWKRLRGELKDRDLRVAANYDEVARYLDVEQFADYLVLAFYAGFGDWPFNNWYGGNRNEPPTPFQFYMWDGEISWVDVRRRDGARRDPGTPWNIQEHFRSQLDRKGDNMVGLWHALRKNGDFMTLFADRVHRHCFRDGALSDARSIERWETLNAFVEDAILMEAARWGDAREAHGEPTRTPETFEREAAKVKSMMEGAAERFIAALRREGYYPALDPPVLLFRRGPFGVSLMLENPTQGGEIFFTTDGTDPRARGGALAAGHRFESAIPIDERTTVRARVRRGGEWSALVEGPVEPEP